MRHFFAVYKMLEGKETSVEEVKHRDEAVESVRKSIDAYRGKFG
jgi:inorganic pyrophosphatase